MQEMNVTVSFEEVFYDGSSFPRNSTYSNTFYRFTYAFPSKYAYLWSLCLNPPHASRAVDHRVLRYDFTGVDLTEGADDAATGEDHVPADVGYATQRKLDMESRVITVTI